MTRGALLSSLSSSFCTVESRGPTEVEGRGEKVGGQQIWGSSRGPIGVGFFLPPLPKSEVGGQVEGPVGDALWIFTMVGVTK
jgi:hypothetical protein